MTRKPASKIPTFGEKETFVFRLSWSELVNILLCFDYWNKNGVKISTIFLIARSIWNSINNGALNKK
ncbi:hypothetical protein BpHYR1_025438 [Brachionus plicatilis]|uniref:Uncharacterized protein n=1 Tax=Brachionus plicatilis TaxID=10195 RepID=A0A3M7PPP4_BRAPC|nr:hypothetical protein BpHYR1_025438 [Brachionus plicatilis]